MQKEAIEQSEKAYIEQFDPTSPNYHGGTTTPVPLGGNRVPESMPSQHPQNFNPGQVGPTSQQLGPEYIRIENERAMMTSLKKLLDKISPFVEAIFRHQQTFKAKADKTNQKHIELHKADVLKQEKEIESLEAQVLETINKLIQSSQDFKEVQKQVQIVLKQARTHFETKEELTQFGFKLKRLTAKIFSDTKKQMQALKKIKKNYKPAPKVETVQELAQQLQAANINPPQ